jgi:hypothetical protein
MLSFKQLVEYVVLDTELLGPTLGRWALADVQVRPSLPLNSERVLSFGGGNNQRVKAMCKKLPARVLQRCLLTLFRHPLFPLLP